MTTSPKRKRGRRRLLIVSAFIAGSVAAKIDIFDLPPQESRTLTFFCGMNMLKGAVAR